MFLENFTTLVKILHSSRGDGIDKSHLWLMMQRKSVPRLSRDGSAVTTSGLVLTILLPISENNKTQHWLNWVIRLCWHWYGIGTFFLLNCRWMLAAGWMRSNYLCRESATLWRKVQSFTKWEHFPANQALHTLLCQYFAKLWNYYLVSSFRCQSLLPHVWSRHSDVKVFYLMFFPARHIPPKADRCCNQYSSLVIPSTFYYQPPLLPIIPPCCIRGRWHCQDLRKWNWVFNFLLFKSDTGTGKWKCFFPLKTDTGTGWLFQLAAKVSSKLAVILAIQLLGLKWEFKVNFMQI